MSIKKDKRLALEKGATIEALQEVYDGNLKDVVFHSRRQSDVPAIEKAYRACVIFAQENGGSGVCLNEQGLILTCAHCLRKPTLGQKHYVIFTNGLVCLTESVFVDEIADVAFIQASLPAHVETLTYASFATKFIKRETLYWSYCPLCHWNHQVPSNTQFSGPTLRKHRSRLRLSCAPYG